jgi:hypothetical protein
VQKRVVAGPIMAAGRLERKESQCDLTSLWQSCYLY